ncbi:PLP-dependent transferase [Marasmius fiardii PR-910]|nr:PLP-dependent transferase [Marasmius fiardii PR-910]
MEHTYGHSMLSHFMLDHEFLNLNNGAFGCLPRAVQESYNKAVEEVEKNPDVFIRKKLSVRSTEIRQRLAKLVNAEEDECVLVPNADHGISLILRSIPWNSDDTLIYTSTAFVQVKRNVTFLPNKTTSPRLSEFPLLFPESDKALLDRFALHIRQVKNTSVKGSRIVALFDAIVSTPAISMPWKEMVAICRDEGVLSIIDAAHSIGHELNINLNQAKPDFWAGNCSKWLWAKRGTGLLYVPKQNQHMIPHNLPVGIPLPAATPFAAEFVWNGSADVALPSTIGAALDFRASIGGEEQIIKYCRDLLLRGSKRLAEILQTDVMEENASSKESMLCMSNVRLPLKMGNNREAAEAFDEKLLEERKAYATIFYHNGAWWARPTAQIYNEISDFERFGKILLEVCQEVEKEFGGKPSS